MVTQAAKRMQKTIEEAYLDLLEKESFRAVTVTQIAQAALINRQTFYHHYQDTFAWPSSSAGSQSMTSLALSTTTD